MDREKKCGDFWLTGSQTFRMMKRVTESLAGRAGVVRMEGLSNSEINRNHFPAFAVDIPALMGRMSVAPQMTISEVFARIYKGSMPRLYENEQVDREHTINPIWRHTSAETSRTYFRSATRRHF